MQVIRAKIWQAGLRCGLTACLLMLAVACQSSQPAGSVSPETEDYPFYLAPLGALIDHHRQVTTQMDGPRCPMYPSCSAYAARAVQKGGLAGVFLFVDRLFFREFGNLNERYVVVPAERSQRIRYYDPVRDVLPGNSDRRPSLLQDDF